MTSKEKCEALMEYIVEENQGYFDKKRIGNDLTAILIDLEEYECFKALMGTPIQDILKRLKMLEILKENANLYVNDVNKNVKSIQINITTCDDNFNKVEEWLNDK